MEREVKTILKKYDGIKTTVRLEDGRSKRFDVNVRIHQRSVLSFLVFAVVLDKIAKDFRGVLKEFLCTDNLVLLSDNWLDIKEVW